MFAEEGTRAYGLAGGLDEVHRQGRHAEGRKPLPHLGEQFVRVIDPIDFAGKLQHAHDIRTHSAQPL
jgi:hypothetical protein